MEAGGGDRNSHSMLQFPVNLYCNTNGADDPKPINEMDFFADKKDIDVDDDLDHDQSKFTDDNNSHHIHHDINVSFL